MGKPLKAVLFDFDGTLTRPGSLDFNAIRQAVGCPAGKPILEYIETLAPGEPQDRVVRILECCETEAAERSQPNAGAEDLILFLKTLKLKLGILTRNSLNSVHLALRNFTKVQESDFHVIITRYDPARPKPHPDGVLLAARKMNITPAQMLVVGDYVFDIEAGRRAGARTAFLNNGTAARLPAVPSRPGGMQAGLPDPPADFTITALHELKAIIRHPI